MAYVPLTDIDQLESMNPSSAPVMTQGSPLKASRTSAFTHIVAGKVQGTYGNITGDENAIALGKELEQQGEEELDLSYKKHYYKKSQFSS
ncbi:hypothetical protein K7432_000201 [Basidiobolus ranarum]|uniref:Uncharacterized protein n=1 Tax=Basidiobolus ranarum TaxID=34480 RepID=A0ABR2WBI8_9FUNG